MNELEIYRMAIKLIRDVDLWDAVSCDDDVWKNASMGYVQGVIEFTNKLISNEKQVGNAATLRSKDA